LHPTGTHQNIRVVFYDELRYQRACVVLPFSKTRIDRMRKTASLACLAGLTAVAIAFTTSAASAKGWTVTPAGCFNPAGHLIPPVAAIHNKHCIKLGGGGGGGGKHHHRGARHHRGGGNGNNAALGAAACILGNGIVATSSEETRTRHLLLWNLGCWPGASINPAGGVIGGATLLAFFGEPTGIFTKTFRPGGWTCQPQDAGLTPGCKEWLASKKIVKVSKKKSKRRA
jgi:hypothetical protein